MENATKTEYGYELIWANKETYGAKIMIFNNNTKTDFIFHQNTLKSWFINSGEFKIKWIDTETGKIFEQKFQEGHVFDIENLKPYSVECISGNGSITEANNGVKSDDVFISLSKEFF